MRFAPDPPSRATPTGTIPLREFFDAVAAGRLLAQRCLGCSALWLPPRPLCAACGCFHFEPLTLRGAGVVERYTEIAGPPSAQHSERRHSVENIEKDDNVEALVVVLLDEGLRVTGRYLGQRPEPDPIGLGVILSPGITGAAGVSEAKALASPVAPITFRARR